MKIKLKRIIAGMLSGAIMITAVPVGSIISPVSELFSTIKVWAETYTYGDYSYTLDKEDNAVITKYNGSQGTEVNIPSEIEGHIIKTIGKLAFKSCENIESVYIPDSVTVIEYDAFSSCSSLKKVILSDNLESIGSGAFCKCELLEDIALPDKLTVLGADAFAGCKSLKSITIPEYVNEFPGNGSSGHVFTESGLESVVIKNNFVPGRMFYECKELKEVTFDGKVTEIEKESFKYCESLENIEIPDSVITVGYDAFSGCTNLRTVKMSDNLESMGSGTFYKCEMLKDIILPDTLTVLGADAFSGCKSLKSITIPANVAEFPGNGSSGHVFQESGLESVVIKNDIVPKRMFYKCEELKWVTFDGNITEIDNEAFMYCESLEGINIPDSVTSMGYSVFYGCTALGSVRLSENIEYLGEQTFYNCQSLESITVPDSVTLFYNTVFAGCKSLTDIHISPNVTSIGKSAFEGCTSLESIVIPDKAEAIPFNAFMDCKNLREIHIGKGVKEIDEQSFWHCEKLKNVRIDGDVENISYNAFYGCNNLECISIADENSASVISLIDMEMPYTADVTGIKDSGEKAVDVSRCGYHSSTASVPASGIVGMEVKYSFKPDAENSVSDTAVIIKMPSDTSIVEGTLKADGTDAVYEFNKKKNLITIPVTSKSGTVKFSIAGVAEASYLNSYARMSYKKDGEEKIETIGIVNILENLITISVPSNTSKDTLTVKGLAAPDKTITIYIDGSRADTCRSAAAGRYSCDITLPGAEDGKTYKIEAAAEKNDKIASAYVTYDKNSVELTRFDMYFNGIKYDLMELDGRRPVLSWNKLKTFSFNLSFNDNSKVENVKVVSTKNGEIRKADAVYDRVNNCFVTEPSFKGYIVGTFTVEYDLVSDFSPVAGTTKEWQSNYTVGNCAGSVTKINFPGGEDCLYYFEENESGVQKPSGNMYTYRQNGNTYYMSCSDVWFYRDKGVFTGREFYIQNALGNYDVYRYGIGMFTDNSGVKTFTEKAALICEDTDADDILKTRFDGAGRGEYYELALKIKKLLESKFIYPDDPLIKKLMELIKSGIDNAERLKKLIEEYDKNRKGYLRYIYIRRPVNTLPPVTTASGETVTTVRPIETTIAITTNAPDKTEPYTDSTENKTTSETTTTTTTTITTTTVPETNNTGTIITTVTSNDKNNGGTICPKPVIPECYTEYILIIIEKIRDFCPVNTVNTGGSCPVGCGCVCDIYVTFKIIIDPSGNVYEGVMSNRVSDAEAKIYYKDENGKAVLWDAEEYDQHNPIYSDNTGYYAWDVPEGMWQVEVNKDGYGTVYSDWLPVPPEQLEVHLGMISNDTPKVDFVSANTGHIDVRFTQYVNVSKVNSDTVKFDIDGKSISYTAEPLDAESSPDDSSLMLARTFRFNTEDTLSGKLNYSISGIVNYAGKEMSPDCSGTVDVEMEITGFKNPDTAQVSYTNTTDVIIKAEPAEAAAGKRLMLKAEDEYIISIPESAVFDDEGKAVIPVTALMPGETFISCSVKETVLEETIKIVSKVDMDSLKHLAEKPNTEPPKPGTETETTTTTITTTTTAVTEPVTTETTATSVSVVSTTMLPITTTVSTMTTVPKTTAAVPHEGDSEEELTKVLANYFTERDIDISNYDDEDFWFSKYGDFNDDGINEMYVCINMHYGIDSDGVRYKGCVGYLVTPDKAEAAFRCENDPIIYDNGKVSYFEYAGEKFIAVYAEHLNFGYGSGRVIGVYRINSDCRTAQVTFDGKKSFDVFGFDWDNSGERPDQYFRANDKYTYINYAVYNENRFVTTIKYIFDSGADNFKIAGGDISGNDKIDLYDAISVAKYLVGKITFNDTEMEIADFNCDGRVDLYDAIDIAKYMIIKP